MIRPGRAGPGSDMLGQWQGARASYSPHQAGLQGLRRMGWDPRIQLTVESLGRPCTPPPCPVPAVGSREWWGGYQGVSALGLDFVRWGLRGIWGLQAPLDVSYSQAVRQKVYREQSVEGDPQGQAWCKPGGIYRILVSVGSGVAGPSEDRNQGGVYQ